MAAPTLTEVGERLARETREAYRASPFSSLSTDYFARFWRDPAAVPVAQADMRLDFHYGGDHTFPHLLDMLEAKIRLVQRELEHVLPEMAHRWDL